MWRGWWSLRLICRARRVRRGARRWRILLDLQNLLVIDGGIGG